MPALEPAGKAIRTVPEDGEEADGKVTLPWLETLNVFCVRKLVRGIVMVRVEGWRTRDLVAER